MSTVDQFCYKVVKMTYKEYINRKQKGLSSIAEAAGFTATGMMSSFGTLTNRTLNAIEDEVSGHMWGARHSDDRPGFNFEGVGSVPERPLQRQLQMGDLIVFDRSINQFRRAIINDLPVERIRLSTETQSPEFLRWVLTGTFEIPPNTHLMPGGTLGINNDNIGVRIVDGTVTEELHPGDIVRLNENGEWVKVSVPEPTD